nr:exocyst complex component 3-like protein 4 [Nothobranchius furzeri]XP_054598066.1 exocyst complex component 3-like protein 4 [Nothobranchius furzeri]XP_054598067.1 exocyst complex component 3-like protein 4 [Nothobranchius furzeri]XP_054598068.1 exocyst complex component 3-like protein 4 [Nothobranchius furzeri]
MMDKSNDNPDEDNVSLQSNEKMANVAVKETLGVLQSLRRSFRRPSEKAPRSPKSKEFKVTAEAEAAGSESDAFLSQPPPSPGLRASSPPSPSPRSSEGFFLKREEDQPDVHKHKPLARSKTDATSSRLGDSFMKKGASFRRSLRFGNKRDGERNSKQGPPLADDLLEKTDKKEEIIKEVEELYTLPEIPQTPPSVMQISKMIEVEVLEVAHVNLLSLRLEYQKEREQRAADCSVELSKKEKDLNLLYRDLRNKISTIVRESNSLPVSNKTLLVPIACIIQEEERRAGEPGGLPDSWMEAWRESVYEGVRVKVNNVHLDQREQNSSWLAVHLGLLGKTIVEDLENVKRDLKISYPASFRVFSTYVTKYHKVVGQHLKKLEPEVTELKDLYALLDWILNEYESEKIMSCPSLQPEITEEHTVLQLEENFLKQLKDKFCCKVKEDMRETLERVIQLEFDDFWKDRKMPQKEDNFLNAPFHMDIWTKVKGTIVNCGKLEPSLEKKVTSSCIGELKNFPKRFETEFKRHCSAFQPQPLWAQYLITYINSFAALLEHMEGYQDSCPKEVEEFRGEVKWLIARLRQTLEDQFKEDIKPYMRRMMTRKWLTSDEDFNHLRHHTELLSQHCDVTRPPHAQEFVSELHYHVVREYIGQLMKYNYNCRNRRHERAAAKIRHQWSQLRHLFENMKSSHEWLHHVGDDLSDIIGQKNKKEIKNHLMPLVEHYSDFSRKHLVAVLYFRGLQRGREHQLILQQLTKLKKEVGNVNKKRSQVLFEDIQVTARTDCLSRLLFVCDGVMQGES